MSAGVHVSFLASDLGKWDAAENVPETLVLPFFVDERPLRGAAGLCDWRLCGRLSRMLQSARVGRQVGRGDALSAGQAAAVRAPVAGRARPRRPLRREGGARGRRHDRRQDASSWPRPRYALVPPGRSTGRLSARRALEIYLEEAGGVGASADVVIVESVAGQKEAADLARQPRPESIAGQ